MNALLSYTNDLKNGTLPINSGATFVCGDEGAHELRVSVLDDGAAADLTGLSAAAYCVLSNRATATENAEISDNVVSVTFPGSFYAVAGETYVLLRLTKTGYKNDVLCMKYNVRSGTTSTVYDPAGELPDLADMQAAIDAADAAAELAEAKAALAVTAAGNANTKAELANAAAGNADTKAALANEKATLADEKAALAVTAAGTANTAAALLTGLTVEASAVATDADVAPVLTEVEGAYHLALKAPRGQTGAKGNTGTRGSLSHSGTAITGTSATPAVYATGIASAIAGDRYYYAGTDAADIGNVYRCTLGGNAATAKWVYDGNIRGAPGSGNVSSVDGALPDGDGNVAIAAISDAEIDTVLAG